jgi:hypothetical protein
MNLDGGDLDLTHISLKKSFSSIARVLNCLRYTATGRVL